VKDVASRVPLQHMQAFLDQTRGQITIGEIPPIRRAVLAAVGKARARSALWDARGEKIGQLLERLDTGPGQGDGRRQCDRRGPAADQAPTVAVTRPRSSVAPPLKGVGTQVPHGYTALRNENPQIHGPPPHALPNSRRIRS